MLYVSQLTLIDVAEAQDSWLARVQQQWKWGARSLLAVRVRDGADKTLGSTVPKPLTRLTADSTAVWGTRWVLRAVPIPTDPATSQDTTETVCDAHAMDDPAHATTPSDALVETEVVADGVAMELATPASREVVLIEVLTWMGEVVATAVVRVGNVAEEDVGRWFPVLLVPRGGVSVGPDTVYALLQLCVLHVPSPHPTLSALVTRLGAEVRALDVDAMPLHVEHDSVLLSTTHLYYPACFLTTVGMYIVSNVVCVESRCDGAVRVEFVVTGDRALLYFAPTTALTLSQKGERGYMVCTWHMFRPFPTSTTPHAVPRVHVLVHEGEQSKPSIDLHVHGEPPRPEVSPPFCFFVNHTMITNLSCSAAERTVLRGLLPIFTIAADAPAAPSVEDST